MNARVADVLVLAALPEELRAVRALLSDAQTTEDDARHLDIQIGELGGKRVALAVTGDGARNARAAAAAALERVRPRALIAIGVAGALSPDLAGGDIVVVHRVVDEQTSMTIHPAPVGSAAAGARPGVAVTARRIADTVDDKRRLLAVARPAPGEAAIVDLESMAYAQAAAAAGVPWLILRAISDTADEALPGLLNDCLDDDGAVSRARVLGALLRHPAGVLQLIALRRRVHACADVLARAVEQAVAYRAAA